MGEGGVFEEHVEAIRTRPTSDPERTRKIADDLIAMDKVMVAITGEDGVEATVHWHNTAMELLIDALEEMEQAYFFDSITRNGSPATAMEGMQLARRKVLVLAFMIGHELGEGEYQIEKHTGDDC